jgi:hypothetical protein
MASNNKAVVGNKCGKYEQKRLCLNFRHNPGICLEGLRNTTKNLRIADFLAGI